MSTRVVGEACAGQLIPCIFNPNGVSSRVCKNTTGVVGRNHGCSQDKCKSPFRACRACVGHPGKIGTVVDPKVGLCAHHLTHGEKAPNLPNKYGPSLFIACQDSALVPVDVDKKQKLPVLKSGSDVVKTVAPVAQASPKVVFTPSKKQIERMIETGAGKVYKLNSRLLQILKLSSGGMTNTLICQRTRLHLKTIENYATKTYGLLGIQKLHGALKREIAGAIYRRYVEKRKAMEAPRP